MELDGTRLNRAATSGAPPNALAPDLQPLSLAAAGKARAPASIERLPNELLANIFGFLDSIKPSSSESALLDEPSFDLTKSEHVPYKAASRVSRRWRRITIPLLFKHAQFTVRETEPWPILDNLIQPFFDFIGNNQLHKVVQSFVLLFHNKYISSNLTTSKFSFNDFSIFWQNIFKVIDPKELLVVAPAESLGALTSCHVYVEDAWRFDCPCHYLRLQTLPESPTSLSLGEGVPSNQYQSAGPSHQVVDPLTGNSSANNIPEGTLGHDPKSDYYGAQASAEYQSEPEASSSAIGESNKPESHTGEVGVDEKGRAKSSALFDIRPWTNLLLNEGSFIRAYATYEFWLRQPPSVSS